MSGIVFILTNPYMPDLVLIDTAPDEFGLKQRVGQLSSHETIPESFSIYHARSVTDAEDTLEKIAGIFSDGRIDPEKKFFRSDPEKVTKTLQLVSGNDVVIDDTSANDLEDQKKRKVPARPFRFSMVGLEPGTELHFSRNISITATVEDDRHIMFEGEVTSLSSAAKKVFAKHHGKHYQSLWGPNFWMHAGETLAELRLRLEEAEEEEMRQVG